jgi:hypothetical protein
MEQIRFLILLAPFLQVRVAAAAAVNFGHARVRAEVLFIFAPEYLFQKPNHLTLLARRPDGPP